MTTPQGMRGTPHCNMGSASRNKLSKSNSSQAWGGGGTERRQPHGGARRHGGRPPTFGAGYPSIGRSWKPAAAPARAQPPFPQSPALGGGQPDAQSDAHNPGIEVQGRFGPAHNRHKVKCWRHRLPPAVVAADGRMLHPCWPGHAAAPDPASWGPPLVQILRCAPRVGLGGEEVEVGTSCWLQRSIDRADPPRRHAMVRYTCFPAAN